MWVWIYEYVKSKSLATGGFNLTDIPEFKLNSYNDDIPKVYMLAVGLSYLSELRRN